MATGLEGAQSAGRSTAAARFEGGYQLRRYTDADEDAAMRLHDRAFARPWSRELWRWRSRAAFGGEPLVMAAFDGTGRCAALMAGVRLPCRIAGEPSFVISVSNSVLDPDLNRTLLGARLFLQVVDRFVRTFGREPVRMMYGSPIASLVRAMTVHVGIEVLGDVNALAHDLAPQQVPPRAAARLRIARADVVADVDELSRRCAGAAATGVVRDRAFLDWRFAAHPTIGYDLVTARGDAGDLRGLMVLRDGGWRDDLMTLCEWLVPADDEQVERALLAHAIAAARARGRSALATMFSGNAPEYLRWQLRHGFHVRPTSHQVVFRAFARGIDRAFLFDRWRFTVADLEFL